MRKLLFLSLTFILTFGFLSVPEKMLAADTAGIQISPISYNLDIKPGESKDLKLNIKNYNPFEVDYVIETELIDSVTEDGAPSFSPVLPKEGVTSILDWMTFSDPKDGTLAAGEAKNVNFTVSIPNGAEPGGHYAAVFVKQLNKEVGGQTQIAVSSRVGALILTSVPGETVKSAEISDFNPPKFLWKGPLPLSFKVKNTGTVHYDSSAKIKIEPLLGNDVTIDAGTHTIIPDNLRKYETTWNKKYPFGYYKLTSIALDGDGNEVTAVATLWALPLIIVIPLLVFIALVIWLLVYLKRHVKIV